MKVRIGISIILLLVTILGMSVTSVHSQDDVVEIVIINTSDEHGWLQPFVPFGSDSTLGGAANILSWWQDVEGYDPDTMLLLSGGDNWTGPSISTWFEGAPMVEAFNLMGYDATAVGNHELDFGRDVLYDRIAESDYPYLAANLRDATTGDLADFVEPYVILEVNGVQVGIIGLITTITPSIQHPRNVEGLEFMEYTDALAMYVPEMREAGAEVVIVLAHVCVSDLMTLAYATDEHVDAMFGGHCHEFAKRTANDIPIMGSGESWHSYARLTLHYNTATGTVEGFEQSLVEVSYVTEDGNPVEPDPDMALLVDEWQVATDEILAQEVGYTSTGFKQRSWAQMNWVTDAWLWAYPTADVAVMNVGGFRQDLPAGAITLADIVGVLPFENKIYDAAITGAQLADNLACCGGAVSGISYTRSGGEIVITFLDGREFDPDAIYHVLVNDFMYFGGDGYLFSEQDPDGYDTGIQWRQPVIDWTKSLNTSPDDPLENHIDATPRGPMR